MIPNRPGPGSKLQRQDPPPNSTDPEKGLTWRMLVGPAPKGEWLIMNSEDFDFVRAPTTGKKKSQIPHHPFSEPGPGPAAELAQRFHPRGSGVRGPFLRLSLGFLLLPVSGSRTSGTHCGSAAAAPGENLTHRLCLGRRFHGSLDSWWAPWTLT